MEREDEVLRLVHFCNLLSFYLSYCVEQLNTTTKKLFGNLNNRYFMWINQVTGLQFSVTLRLRLESLTTSLVALQILSIIRKRQVAYTIATSLSFS